MRYKAFLSYKHGDDDALAISLEKALEKFAKPTFKRRALEIFRDSNDLSVAADLGEIIRNGLRDSEYIICMANPAYAQSKWCSREAEYWRDNKSINNFLIVLTDGEILWDESVNDFDWSVTTAIPKELSGVFKGEPFYIDFRNAGPIENLNLDNLDFKTRLVLIAATLHGKTVGDMVGEAVKQHKRTLMFRNSAVAVIMALMSLTIVLTMISNRRKSASLLHFQAKSTETTNPTLALRLEEEALKIHDYPEFKKSALEIMNRNAFYHIIASKDTAHFTAMEISKEKTMLLASTDGVIGLTDQDGNKIREFTIDKGSIRAAKFAPDGQSFLTASDRGTHLWDLEGGLLVEFKENTLDNTAYVAKAVDFSPDGKRILTGSYSGAHLWDLNGNQISGFEIQSEIESVAFAPDGNAVLIGYYGSKQAAALFDLEGNYKAGFSTEDANFGEPYTITKTVAFSEDGQTVLICSSVNGIQLFTPEGEKIQSFNLPNTVNFEAGPWTAAISPDGSKILTCSFENTGQLWDREGTLIKEFKGHESMINLFAFDPTDDKTVYSGALDHTIRKWYSEGLEATILSEISVSQKPILSLNVAPNNASVLVCTGDSVVNLLDFQGKLLKEFTHNSSVSSASFSPNGKYLLVQSANGIHIWNLEGEPLGEYMSIDESISSYRFQPNGKSVLLSVKSVPKPESHLPWPISAIRQWDWKTNTVEDLSFGDKMGTYASFSQDGETVLTNSGYGAYLWSLEGDSIQTLKLPDEQVNPVAIAPDGTSILTYPSSKEYSLFKTKYGKTQLWNLEGERIQEYKMMDQSVDPQMFTPDGNAILTLSYPELNPWDKGSPTARLWDLKGSVLLELHKPGKYISTIAISPNGNFLAVGYRDNWNPFIANAKENKLVIYKTLGLNEFLDAHVAPLSENQRKEFDID